MKRMIIACSVLLAALWGCGPDNKPDPQVVPEAYEFKIEEDASFSPSLPALQSFVWAHHGKYWIMFSGRTNGFHAFDSTGGANFPVTKANKMIYVYDTEAKVTDSLPVPEFGGDTGNVFLCTNLPHTQRGKYLYACGGYGVTVPQGPYSKKTYNYFMKVDMAKMIEAVQKKDPSAVKRSIKWGQNDLVQNTGGELYHLDDDKFYLCVGHVFTGRYMDTTAKQVYQNSVRVFSITESNSGIELVQAGRIPATAGTDTFEFHRRDLVVAPMVLANGKDVGIGIYGGVFTPTSGPPEANNGVNYTHPIYLDPASANAYQIDPANQFANIYSTAFLSMYDPKVKKMMTTFFGGLGDSLTRYDSSASWTKKITTAERSYAGSGGTVFRLNTDMLPHYMGAEGVFVPSPNAAFYNEDFDVLDYSKLKSGEVVGYIYGGIRSPNGSPNNDQTWASKKVYKVTLIKSNAE